jgi:hypothetical protein
MSKQRNPVAQPAPHSWAIENWPAHVYPHSPGKGRYLIRSNRTKLVEAGALTRVGRDLVVMGAPYSKWLESLAGRVDDFHIAPNRAPAPDQAAAA